MRISALEALEHPFITRKFQKKPKLSPYEIKSWDHIPDEAIDIDSTSIV